MPLIVIAPGARRFLTGNAAGQSIPPPADGGPTRGNVMEMLTDEVREAADRELPQSMLDAQRAVETPEVQRLIKELAKHNLGVYMPHMHLSDDFQEQPAGVLQVEVKSDFVPAAQFKELGVLPVAWRWHEDGVIVSGSCHIVGRKCDG